MDSILPTLEGGEKTTMRIAVLTSGGDSAGMNAVVRAVVKYGIIRYVQHLHQRYQLITNAAFIHFPSTKK